MRYIDFETLKTFKGLLLEAPVEKSVEIEFPDMNLMFHADSVSETIEVDSYYANMRQVNFLNNEDENVLKIGKREYKMFFNIGEWAYETRISDVHLVLTTAPRTFGSDYFCQLELSQALEDEEYIYFVKNFSKLAGKGAIMRLFSGLGANPLEKYNRLNKLSSRLESEIIRYDENEWITVYKVEKSLLNDESNYSDILYGFIKSLLIYAFTIESIIMNDL